MSDAKYYQVELTQSSDEFPEPSTTVLKGWVEERAAKQGAHVEVKGYDGLWYVNRVFGDVPILDVVLKETQRQRRKAPPSIRDTKKDKRQQESAH